MLKAGTLVFPVRGVTWMSANGLHLCKWTVALKQVTLSHLNKCSNELYYMPKSKLVKCRHPLGQVHGLVIYPCNILDC